MDKQSKALFTDKIYRDALQRYHIDPDTVSALDGFESFIYRYQVGDKRRILRITHSIYRNSCAIQAEIDWINDLANHGVSVPRALPSTNGRTVEVLADAAGSHFSAVAFTWAPGQHHWDAGIKLIDLAESMGELMGRMHHLSRIYQPPSTCKRHDWRGDVVEMGRYLPPNQPEIATHFHQLNQAIAKLPVNRDNFGLIHFDFHGGNFFIENGNITLFDFGDCMYHWFAADIAIALFYAIPHHIESEAEKANAAEFLRRLLRGYRREKPISAEALATIPLFLKQREIDLYIVLHRSLDMDNLDDWAGSFMRNRQAKIYAGTPYLDLDFEQFAV